MDRLFVIGSFMLERYMEYYHRVSFKKKSLKNCGSIKIFIFCQAILFYWIPSEKTLKGLVKPIFLGISIIIEKKKKKWYIEWCQRGNFKKLKERRRRDYKKKKKLSKE